ncbi:MAG: hypothetical protein AAB541_03605 [Patescibacteria group bacterium]
MKRPSQKGFTLIGVLAVASALAIVTLVGWNVYQRQQVSDTTAKIVKMVPTAPAVTSVGDLDTASQTLDQTQIDSDVDTAQLDSDLASF